MLLWILAILLIRVSKCQTPFQLLHLDEMDNLAQFDDAQHRGPNFYDYTESLKEPASTLERDDDTSLYTGRAGKIPSQHDHAKILAGIIALDVNYQNILNQLQTHPLALQEKHPRGSEPYYRTCTPCVHDMLKKYTNVGIKWICASYQRARRTFKSECMMRYRNCQDGTMFVKLYDHKCKDDPYHGRTWFYNYRV